jgi:hypothetical protein
MRATDTVEIGRLVFVSRASAAALQFILARRPVREVGGSHHFPASAAARRTFCK